MGETEALDKTWLVGRGRGETPNSDGGTDDGRDDYEPYYLEETFTDNSDPDDFKYVTWRTTILRTMMKILIQSIWEHFTPQSFP